MRTPTVLVLAQAQDSTADRVAAALRRRAVGVARVDTADSPAASRLHARPDQPGRASWLEVSGARIDLAAIRSVYYDSRT